MDVSDAAAAAAAAAEGGGEERAAAREGRVRAGSGRGIPGR